MREIKFRAWDGKKIHNNAIVGNGQVLFIPDATGEYKWDSQADLIPMQYTGLKDKNGKEIYEGDIIRVSTFGFDPETFTASVIWDKKWFTLSNNRSLVYFGQSTNVCDDAVIIGNIYENPELLKETSLQLPSLQP